MCHKSKYQISCEEVRQYNPLVMKSITTVDIDDSGPLEPFDTECIFERKIVK